MTEDGVDESPTAPTALTIRLTRADEAAEFHARAADDRMWAEYCYTAG